MEIVVNAALLLYMAGTIFLVFFVAGFGVLLLIYLLKRPHRPVAPRVADRELLSVTVQLPIFNEPHVVDRLLEACACIDYVPYKLFIQILDDSTDHTTEMIQHKIEELRCRGVLNITHIHRNDRQGYKAGALAHGMQFIDTDCVVIFDADFVPEADFLRRTMPYFSTRPGLGLIQTRWSHLNVDFNLLTRVQALSIDAHFCVEQVARNRGHLPMSMNGTGGIWRTEAILDAGGWSSATLTEDLDLSYRAYMRGWEFLYLVDVAVPGELTPLIQSYKTQQARWAIGSTQCLIKHMPSLMSAREFSPLEKLMGTMHLAQYAVQPVILIMFLLTPLLISLDAIDALPNLTLLAILGFIPPLLIAIGQFELYEDWFRRLLYFPLQLMAAVAIVVSNSRAVFAVLSHPHSEYEFRRTPKFRITRRGNDRFADPIEIDFTIFGELLLGAYACFGVMQALNQAPGLAPYLLTYALSFFLFAFLNIYQVLRLNVFKRI